MTLLDYLKAALAKNEASHGPDDFVSKQLRAQLDSLQGAQPSSHPIKARSHSVPYVRSYNSESMLQKPRVITRTGHPSASSQ